MSLLVGSVFERTPSWSTQPSNLPGSSQKGFPIAQHRSKRSEFARGCNELKRKPIIIKDVSVPVETDRRDARRGDRERAERNYWAVWEWDWGLVKKGQRGAREVGKRASAKCVSWFLYHLSPCLTLTNNHDSTNPFRTNTHKSLYDTCIKQNILTTSMRSCLSHTATQSCSQSTQNSLCTINPRWCACTHLHLRCRRGKPWRWCRRQWVKRELSI